MHHVSFDVPKNGPIHGVLKAGCKDWRLLWKDFGRASSGLQKNAPSSGETVSGELRQDFGWMSGGFGKDFGRISGGFRRSGQKPPDIFRTGAHLLLTYFNVGSPRFCASSPLAPRAVEVGVMPNGAGKGCPVSRKKSESSDFRTTFGVRLRTAVQNPTRPF